MAFLLFTISYFLSAVPAQSSNPELDQVLRSWITDNTHFEKDQNNQDILFIRKQPVRVYIKIDDPEIVAEARTAIANFANAFGLQYEFTATNINMIIGVASGISEKGRPSRSLLTSFGLKTSDIDYIVSILGDSWSTGCGFYHSRDSEGRLGFSIVAGDKGLARKKLKSCIVTGIISAFGLRMSGHEVVDHSNDYIQFLLLARSLLECEKKISLQKMDEALPTRGTYIDCVSNTLHLKLN